MENGHRQYYEGGRFSSVLRGKERFSSQAPGRYRRITWASTSRAVNATRFISPRANIAAWSERKGESERELWPYARTEYARGASVNSTASTQPSPPFTERLPSGSVLKLRTLKQPVAPPHPPTGTSTDPMRTRCTSPQATS